MAAYLVMAQRARGAREAWPLLPHVHVADAREDGGVPAARDAAHSARGARAAGQCAHVRREP